MATDLLQDFGTYFTVAGLSTTDALFYDMMGDGPDSSVAIYEYQGASAPAQVAGSERSIQIVVRDRSALSAKGKINSLYKTLQTDDGIIQLTPERWCVLHLRQPPFKIKVDEKNRAYYGFNVGATTYID